MMRGLIKKNCWIRKMNQKLFLVCLFLITRSSHAMELGIIAEERLPFRDKTTYPELLPKEIQNMVRTFMIEGAQCEDALQDAVFSCLLKQEIYESNAPEVVTILKKK